MKQEILAGLKKTVLDYEFEKAESVAKDAISKGLDPIKWAEALTKAMISHTPYFPYLTRHLSNRARVSGENRYPPPRPM